MGILDTLKKLGILKVGGEAAVYTKAIDRPDSFAGEDFVLSEKKVKPAAPDDGKTEKQV